MNTKTKTPIAVVELRLNQESLLKSAKSRSRLKIYRKLLQVAAAVLLVGAAPRAFANGGPVITVNEQLLLNVTGPTGANGLEGVGPGIQDFQFFASSWTFSSAFSNVSYTTAPNAIYYTSGTTMNYYLTNAIGTSDTSANVLWSGSITFNSSGWDAGTTVFSGLNLGPGTYDLIADPSQVITWVDTYPNNDTVTAVNGVTYDGTFTPVYESADTSFPPASTWNNSGQDSLFALNGVAPEPSTYMMVLGGLALLGFCVRRKPALMQKQ